MTYSLDFRKQVLKSLDNGMTFIEAAEFEPPRVYRRLIYLSQAASPNKFK